MIARVWGALAALLLIATPAVAQIDPAARGLAVRAGAAATANAASVGALGTRMTAAEGVAAANGAAITTNAAGLTAAAQKQAFAVFYARFQKQLADAPVTNPHNQAALAFPAGSVSSTTTQPTIARLPANATTPADYAPYVSWVGGWPRINNAMIYTKSATSTVGAATDGDSADAIGSASRFITISDDCAPTFGVQMDNVLPFRVIMDGRYLTTAGYTPANTTLTFWSFNLTSAGITCGGGVTHRWELEFQSGQKLRYLYRSALKYSFWAPSTTGMRFMQVGDSYTLGPVTGQVDNPMLGDGMARIAGDWLGASDYWPSGIGGTGITWRSSSAAAANALDRVTDVTAHAPDEVTLALGVNDLSNDGASVTIGGSAVTVTTATTQARLTTLLAQYRTALPNTPICVLGPWRFAASVAATATAYETAISAAVTARRAAGDTLIAFQPVISTSWLTGTGGSAASGTYAPKGDGNGDIYYGPYDFHPSFAGHAYLGRRIAQSVVSCMDTIKSQVGLSYGYDLPRIPIDNLPMVAANDNLPIKVAA